MWNKIKNYSVFFLFVIPLFSGLAGGLAVIIILGQIYPSSGFGWPLFNTVDISSDLSSGRMIIREPKSVIVQENAKIKDTADSVSESIVGIFKKKILPDAAAGKAAGDYAAYYNLTDNVPEGIVITGDGWIMAKDFGVPLKNIASGYVAITPDKKIYPIETAIADETGGAVFMKIKANGLPVAVFSGLDGVYAGLTVIDITRSGLILPSYVTEIRGPAGAVKSSDYNPREIILASAPRDSFKGSFIFNLAGELAGFVNRDGKIEHINNFLPAIDSLLKFGAVKRPFFGVNYINLKELDGYPAEKGALVAKPAKGEAVLKNSPADKAGIAEGDIILSVNGTDVDKTNDLETLIARYKIGDKIKIKYSGPNGIKEAEIIIEKSK